MIFGGGFEKRHLLMDNGAGLLYCTRQHSAGKSHALAATCSVCAGCGISAASLTEGFIGEIGFFLSSI